MAYPQCTPSPSLLREFPHILDEADAPSRPPSVCNTKAENSEGVDYVSLVCSHDSCWGTLAAAVGVPVGELEHLPYGGYFYRRCCTWGNVRIYYDGSISGMGSYCQISGQGCRELEAAGKITSWQEFACRCLDVYHLECTRFDLFRDDRQGLLDISELERKFDDGECTTHAQVSDPRGTKVKGMRGKKLTHTLYIGSRKSDSVLRIYDKTKELRPKGRKMDEWEAEHGHHVRVELELKRKRAHAAFKRLARTGFGGGVIPGLIKGFIDFKDGDARGHNGSRLPTWAPWAKFLAQESKVRLAVEVEQKTLSKTLHHHSVQYAPTLAAQCMALGGDEEAMQAWFMEVVYEGRTRMRAKHYRMCCSQGAA